MPGYVLGLGVKLVTIHCRCSMLCHIWEHIGPQYIYMLRQSSMYHSLVYVHPVGGVYSMCTHMPSTC